MSVFDGVLNGAAHQALGAGDAHGLDADAGIGPDLGAHLVAEEIDHLAGLGRALAPLDAGVNVLGILAEDDDVEQFGMPDRGRDAGKVVHGAPADVEVEELAEGDVQAADAAADGRGEGALDGDVVLADGVEGLLREPVVDSFEGFLAGERLDPVDGAAAVVGALDGGVEDGAGGAPDIGANAVAFDEGNDGIVRHEELAVPNLNRLTSHGRLQYLKTSAKRGGARGIAATAKGAGPS